MEERVEGLEMVSCLAYVAEKLDQNFNADVCGTQPESTNSSVVAC